MALSFYYGSGSPYAWRVWLALEHKAIAYELKVVSFSAGDLAKPEFVALNPRRKVPTITDGDFSLYEPAAILEYLEEQYSTGKVLFPGSVRQRAIVRRLVREADEYLAHALERLVDHVLFTKQEKWDLQEIAAGPGAFLQGMGVVERYLRGGWVARGLSAAGFTLYSVNAPWPRMGKKKTHLNGNR